MHANTSRSSGAHTRRSVLGFLATAPVAATGLLAGAGTASAAAADHPELDAKITEIINRPEFQGARWGMTIHVPATGETVHRLNGDELFPAGSTVKYFLSATALSALGHDTRFRTDVYRTGPVKRGTLDGDLVLVAGGDLLMGGRVRPDGSLALPNPDHANNLPDAVPLPGDPLRTLHLLAKQVARHGIRRVDGRVLIDVSLFKPGLEPIALGALKVPVTPIMVNDNVIDVVVRPGAGIGAPAELTMTPDVGYLRIINEVTTTAPETAPQQPFAFVDDVSTSDGTRVVRMTGRIPLSRSQAFSCYYLPDPARFAQLAFGHALRRAGVRVAECSGTADAAEHRAEHLVAQHFSPPVSEAVKVMSNIHSAHWPYLVGAIAGGDRETPGATGRAMQRALQEEAGLDPASPDNGRYTADYYVDFLTYLTARPYFPHFHDLLAVMGRSGSLDHVQVGSPAAGHVYAKAGHVAGKSLGTALAGYIEPPGGDRVVFSMYMEKPQSPSDDMNALWERGTEAQGEIVTAVWENVIAR